MRSIKIAVIAMLSIAACGCGPMFAPLSTPLSEADQKQVDAMWDNMLTPVNRIDRQTLLDTISVFWMFQLGVDRLHLRTEKYLKHGTVIMEADCDRASPQTDEFTVTVLDEQGRTLRRERYSRSDVEDTYKIMWGLPNLNGENFTATNPQGATVDITTEPATRSSASTQESPEMKHLREERERRMKAVEAATQPATVR